MHTYWLTLHGHSDRGSKSSSDERSSAPGKAQDVQLDEPMAAESGHAGCSILQTLTSEKEKNLIKWNVDVLAKMLKQIVADRLLAHGGKQDIEVAPKMCITKQPLEEVVEVVNLPQRAGKRSKNAEALVLDEDVLQQLKDFVTQIAALYRSNPCKSVNLQLTSTGTLVKTR